LYLPLDKIMQMQNTPESSGTAAIAPGAAPASTGVPVPSAGDTRTRDTTRSRERDTR